jgi:Asp-tRNA(Asn)/Glu-tRNA(Gln) amidotransferase A subunit family amidase
MYIFRCVDIDDPEIYHRGPVAVQVVGRRLREEQILEIAEIVSDAIRKHK